MGRLIIGGQEEGFVAVYDTVCRSKIGPIKGLSTTKTVILECAIRCRDVYGLRIKKPPLP